MTKSRWAVATVVGALLLPGAAQASPALRVKDGRARVVNDRLLPPKARTALPAVPRGTAIAGAAHRGRAAQLSPAQRASYDAALQDARLASRRVDRRAARRAERRGRHCRGDRGPGRAHADAAAGADHDVAPQRRVLGVQRPAGARHARGVRRLAGVPRVLRRPRPADPAAGQLRQGQRGVVDVQGQRQPDVHQASRPARRHDRARLRAAARSRPGSTSSPSRAARRRG